MTEDAQLPESRMTCRQDDQPYLTETKPAERVLETLLAKRNESWNLSDASANKQLDTVLGHACKLYVATLTDDTLLSTASVSLVKRFNRRPAREENRFKNHFMKQTYTAQSHGWVFKQIIGTRI